MSTLTRELREKFIAASIQSGLTPDAIGRAFGMSDDSAIAWLDGFGTVLAEAALELRAFKVLGREGIEKAGIGWQLAAGLSSQEIAASSEREQREREVANQYEQVMGYNPLPWWSNDDLRALLVFLMHKTPEEINNFATWSKKEFSSLTPTKARQYPRMVIECFPQAFPNGQISAGDSRYA
jgi:hypothetical protein